MWRAKSIIPTLFLVIQFLVTFHISHGKPTTEEPFNHNTTTEPGDVREDENGNSSFLETVSVLLTVLSPNDTVTAEEDSPSPLNVTANSTFSNYSTTTEPEYYDDHNLTTFSSTLDELDEDKNAVDDLDTLGSSIHLGSSTESSSLLSSLITDEMEVADSLDESVTATMLLLKGDENGGGGGGGTGDVGDNSRTVDGSDVSNKDGSTSSRSHRDTASATDDSIIIASMSYNLNTVEPFSSQTISTDTSPKQEIISSSHLPHDSSSSSAPDSSSYSFTQANIHE